MSKKLTTDAKLTTGRLISYLLYFLLVCSLVFGITYARYVSEIDGTGIAHTAAVELDSMLDLTDELRNLTPGQTKEIAISVNNSKGGTVSEVAQDYSITVTTTGNLPLTFALSFRDGGQAGTYAGTLSQESVPPTWTWSGGRLPHSAESAHVYTLTVGWPEGQAGVSYATEIDLVTLTVDAKQSEPKAG